MDTNERHRQELSTKTKRRGGGLHVTPLSPSLEGVCERSVQRPGAQGTPPPSAPLRVGRLCAAVGRVPVSHSRGRRRRAAPRSRRPRRPLTAVPSRRLIPVTPCRPGVVARPAVVGRRGRVAGRGPPHVLLLWGEVGVVAAAAGSVSRLLLLRRVEPGPLGVNFLLSPLHLHVFFGRVGWLWLVGGGAKARRTAREDKEKKSERYCTTTTVFGSGRATQTQQEGALLGSRRLLLSRRRWQGGGLHVHAKHNTHKKIKHAVIIKDTK